MAEATPPIADPSARGALGQTPIPGGNPAGEAPNAWDEFEELRGEATKDPVQGPPAWDTVARIGETLLREKTKDFVVASYAGVAFAQVDGVAGVHDGLCILEGLLKNFWDAASPPVPKRLRARANAISWYAEKVAAQLERTDFKPEDAERVDASLEVAMSLSDLLGERFPADSEVGIGPILSSLRDANQRLAADAAAAAPPPQAAPATSSAPAPKPAPASASIGDGEISNRNDAVRLIRKVAGFFREQNAMSGEAMALVRLTSWSQVKQAPPANGGKTVLPAPNRAEVENAAGSGPETLVRAAESAFASSPLWLDLQRHVVTSLDQLGAEHRGARDLVVSLLRDLLSRAPSLPSLQFADGSDLADGATRQWLADEVLTGADAAAAAPAPAGATSIDPAELAALRREVPGLIKKGQIAEAQTRVEALYAEDRSPQGRFRERLELATLCFDAGKPRIALGILDGLESETRTHELDRWDPGLAAQVLAALYRAHLKVLGKNATPEQAERREDVFGRLCRLDPALAANLD